MKLKGLIAAPIVALLVTALSAAPDPLPEGWTRAGNASSCVVRTVATPGAPAAKSFEIACPKSAEGFATAMQTISAADFAGKRVRLAAQVQGEAVQTWAGLWLRGDAGASIGRVFDNMETRPLKGSFAWREASVVLQFPADIDTLSFGMLLGGPGRLRATAFRLEVVDASVPLTEGPKATMPTRPTHMTPP